ncbi:MAG: antitoxin Xre/MbcA/ParS toxin-binding domain-containing protein [Sphingobium sp.]|nr:antitoxin Xre/MbcA/ParS toxin-binding domain-containing protein [Sphingobium sp.]
MTNRFRNRFSGPRLLPEQAARQGQVSRTAFLVLGKDEAIRFLNSHDEALGGRPLDLATQSPDGLQTVEAHLATRKAVAGG